MPDDGDGARRNGGFVLIWFVSMIRFHYCFLVIWTWDGFGFDFLKIYISKIFRLNGFWMKLSVSRFWVNKGKLWGIYCDYWPTFIQRYRRALLFILDVFIYWFVLAVDDIILFILSDTVIKENISKKNVCVITYISIKAVERNFGPWEKS